MSKYVIAILLFICVSCSKPEFDKEEPLFDSETSQLISDTQACFDSLKLIYNKVIARDDSINALILKQNEDTRKYIKALNEINEKYDPKNNE
jgi:hypothetical protein